MEKPGLAKKLWGPWATAGLGLAVIAVLFLIQVLVVVVYSIITVSSHPGPTPPAEFLNILLAHLGLLIALATCISAVICLGLIILFIRVRKGASIAEYLGLKRISGKKILIILAIMLGFMVAAEALGVWLGKPPHQEYLDMYNTSVWPAFLGIAIVIFAPAFEETLFRGFLFEGFRQSRIGPIGAIGLTALGWALLHIQYGFYDMGTMFALGIVLGIVRFKTDSLWSPLIMHAFNNLVAMVLVALGVSGLIG
jgi:membrane protease YdiL (CAAX protease family)